MDHVLTLHVMAISDIRLVMVFFSDLLLSVEYKVGSDSRYIYRCVQFYYAAPYIKNLFPKLKCAVVVNKQHEVLKVSLGDLWGATAQGCQGTREH